ncbi:M1 family aminopeptidase [Phenylobacterium terrae]|uniref:M1 family aminopeptidase n=1 Tax=Phenylobacterium terrae TaxID=2665495 RepID=A0ABW4MZ33_9CAUL
MPRLPIGRAAALAAAWVLSAGAATAAPAFDVLGYEVELRPDLVTGEVEGRETVRLRSRVDGLASLDFSAGALRLEDVRIDGIPAAAPVQADGRLTLALPQALRRGRTATLSFAFSGRPRRGLVATDRVLHTSYFTCDWMVCDQEAPGDMAALDLTLDLPAGAQAVATGRPRGVRARGDRRLHRFTLERPSAPFVFGWAAGEFTAAVLPGAGPELLVLSDAASEPELARIFQDARAMIDFFEEKAGVAFPFDRYVQVVTAGSSAQEAAGLSFLGLSDVRPILTDPEEDWAIAHELAHQWWGVLVACEDLSHFWLNEGLATFMTAAWKEHRWGRSRYDREMALARARWDRARAQGFDRPLNYAGTYPNLSARRAIAYSKAALFIDALRTEMGEAAFWRGLAAYTRRHAGRTANSADFQAAMEAAAGRSLAASFGAWVYDQPPPGAAGAGRSPVG